MPRKRLSAKQAAHKEIKEGMRALVEFGAKKKLGAEQLRILLDELLTDYVDYPHRKVNG